MYLTYEKGIMNSDYLNYGKMDLGFAYIFWFLKIFIKKPNTKHTPSRYAKFFLPRQNILYRNSTKTNIQVVTCEFSDGNLHKGLNKHAAFPEGKWITSR